MAMKLQLGCNKFLIRWGHRLVLSRKVFCPGCGGVVGIAYLPEYTQFIYAHHLETVLIFADWPRSRHCPYSQMGLSIKALDMVLTSILQEIRGNGET